MRIETLRERIENTKAKIEKKANTIEKKHNTIEKKRNTISKKGFNPDADRYEYKDNDEIFWLMCDIHYLQEDIERNTNEISELKKSLEKYEAQMNGEMAKESIILKEIPETMKRMQTELVTEWDRWDKERRENLKAKYNELGYKGFFERYNRADYEFRYLTDEQIHNSNEQAAKELILNLYYRVKAITGEITDWSGIYATVGTWGGCVLNGTVIGKEGKATVESIYAGGYNIQRLHVRVLVHEWK